MTENAWKILAPLAPFVFANLAVIGVYVAITAKRRSKGPTEPPNALLYLPVAIAGMLVGNTLFETLLYRSEFWLTRHARSFEFESKQGLSFVVLLATYGFFLHLTHRKLGGKTRAGSKNSLTRLALTLGLVVPSLVGTLFGFTLFGRGWRAFADGVTRGLTPTTPILIGFMSATLALACGVGLYRDRSK